MVGLLPVGSRAQLQFPFFSCPTKKKPWATASPFHRNRPTDNITNITGKDHPGLGRTRRPKKAPLPGEQMGLSIASGRPTVSDDLAWWNVELSFNS